jgi:hypothetical protein
MKKKLEAELISIAHRILKLKNRAELDQLQAEALKLYEKISVLKFVEDNFAEVKPTISYSSAEETLEEIYGIEETAPVHANEVEASEDEARAGKAKKADEKPSKKQDKESESGEGVTAGKEEAPVAEPEKEEAEDTADSKPEGDADPEQKTDEYQASEEEKEETEESGEEVQGIEREEEASDAQQEEMRDTEEETVQDDKEENEPEAEEPEHKIEVVKPQEDVKAMEEGAAAVFEKEDGSTPEEEEKAIDAEIITIEPDKDAKTEDSGASFGFAFERTPAPEEPVKQKEITFEDYHDYKEPEFVKKDEEAKAETPKEEAPKEEAAKDDDWRNWEPSKSEVTEQPKQEEKKEMPKAEAKQPQSQSKSLNDAFGKSITLGLNDRIAFEKHLFGGSGEDLNRVLSQLTTINSYDEARNFIDDLVKPDYNNWKGKEEYEERFMALIEKKFS